MSRIFVVGSRAVGFATGAALIADGHRVTLVDEAPKRVAELAAQGFDARGRLDLAGEPESFVFLCPPTAPGGRGWDLSAMEHCAALTGRSLAVADAPHTVVVRSTVPPGTTSELVGPVLERWSGLREGSGFALAACPDLGIGSGPAMTVVGSRSDRTAHRLGDLMQPVGGALRVFDDPAPAELIKCAASLFDATKISFWNEIWGVCTELGLDPDQVADAVAGAARGSTDPGFGVRGGAPYGGAQLPADTSGFISFAAELGIPMPLLGAVMDVNTRYAQRMSAELDDAGRLWARSTDQMDDDARPTDADPAPPRLRPAGQDAFGRRLPGAAHPPPAPPLRQLRRQGSSTDKAAPPARQLHRQGSSCVVGRCRH